MMGKIGMVVILAMTEMLAACTSSTTPPPRPPATGVVAWIATPAPTMTTTTTTTPLAVAPYCLKSQLRVQTGSWSTARSSGNGLFVVHLTNTGKATCRLSGYPTMTAVTGSGAREPMQPGHDNYVAPANLRPGDTGEFEVAEGVCFGGTTTTSFPGTLIVKLPRGDGSVTVDSYSSNVCAGGYAVSESQMGVVLPAPGESAQERDLTYAQPDVRIPALAKGGRVLHYLLLLSAGTSRTLSLLPCPGYTEILTLGGNAFVGGVGASIYKWSYELNCHPASELVPGRTLKFAMDLPVPQVSKAQQATLTWQWAMENSPSVTTSLTVHP